MQFANLNARLRQALQEDGAFNDITTKQLPKLSKERLPAHVISKGKGIFCGAALAAPLFTILDRRAKIRLLKKDGAAVKKGEKCVEIRSSASAILGGERTF